jgi:hypothetical protein
LPKLSGCKVVLFAATGENRQGTPDLGWLSRCTQVLIEKVDGRHDTMLSKRGPGSLHQKLPQVLTDLPDERVSMQPAEALETYPMRAFG